MKKQFLTLFSNLQGKLLIQLNFLFAAFKCSIFLLGKMIRAQAANKTQKAAKKIEASLQTDCREMKTGKIARTLLRQKLQTGSFSKEYLLRLQDDDYSKQVFGINYPLLAKTESASAQKIDRYYAKPIKINGEFYFICSEWYVKSRPLLLTWIDAQNQK